MKLAHKDIRPGVLVEGHNGWFRRVLDVRGGDARYTMYYNLGDAEGSSGMCSVTTMCQWGVKIVEEPDADQEAEIRKAADAQLLHQHRFLVEYLRETERHLKNAGLPFTPYAPEDADG